MGVLQTVLEGLEASTVTLEAYGRSGNLAAKVSSAEFVAHVRRSRQAFRGWDAGGRKVICLLFRPEEAIEFLVATLAAMSEGWTIVPFFPNWSDEQQRLYLRTYNLRAIVVGQGFEERARAWEGDCVDRVLTISLDESMAAPLPREFADEPLFANITADHPCAWLFTSGTSGKLAKLTEITLGNIEAAIENIRDLDFVYPEMTLHNPLSTSHIFAFSVILGLLAVKPRRLIFSDVQYLTRLPESRTGKVNAMILVPIVLNRMRTGFYEKLTARMSPRNAPAGLEKLAKIPLPVRRQLKRIVQTAEEAVIDLEQGRSIGLRRRAAILTARRVFGPMLRQRLGSPEFVVLGGAKPNLHSMAFLEVMGVRCLQGWGMTETTGPLAVQNLADRFKGALGTCGRPFSNTRAYVEDGELVVEGPQIARGYHDPDGTFIPFNGKKRTGDYAEFDADGRLKVLGKASDRITTENGLNYNPIPLEENLQAIDLEKSQLLEEVVVIGDGQPRLGAVFFLRAGVEDGDETRAYLESRLKEFNTSRPVDERVESWTVSGIGCRESGVIGPTGKLLRRLVEERYAVMYSKSTVGAS